MTKVILLEKMAKVGNVGDVVDVKAGYMRNYMLPRGLAVRATGENIAKLEKDRARLEAENLLKLQEAQNIALKFQGVELTIAKQAAEDGSLYGSVTAKEILALLIEKTDIEIDVHTIKMPEKIKHIGSYIVELVLHSDVVANISLIVTREEQHEL